jgi:Cdc6-like AAA superfamily ATPase
LDRPRREKKLDITLSAEQKALLEIMEETRQHLFITGRAGAGKSVLLRHFREHTAKKVVIAAPTGIAALNVRGQTIHSLFRIAPQLHRKGDLALNPRVCSLLKRIDTLVIDEISMVRADLLDAVDERLREACKKNLPFGGVQVIMFGDVYQLPPVVEEGLMPYFEAVHNGYFFFNALVWKAAEFKIYELSQVFRQKDPVFKDVLNAVRDGSVVDDQIEALNARSGIGIPDEGTVTLAPTNALVTTINQQRLDQLPGAIHHYQAKVTGEMKKSVFPTEEHLSFKKDAQIVLLKNDKDGRWVNGTVGKIEKLFDDHIDVRVGNIVYSLERETWEEIVYTYDQETQKVEAKVTSSFTQYPVRLAWALTIHKSQGQTYESIALDLTTATFAPGQLYVALSRATSLEGLYLKMPVKRAHIIVEPKVTAFMLRREAIEIAVVEEAQTVTEVFHHDEIVVSVNEVQEQTKAVAVLSDIRLIENYHDEIEQEIIVNATIVHEDTLLAEGKVSRIAAIEVLCPACNSPCFDPKTGSLMITYEVVGHTVVCAAISCGKSCTVPLNAFSMQGDVVAREKPAGVTTKREKQGRTKKERKSQAGRKTKSGTVREPMQLSLDTRTIKTLNAMGINKSELFEDLLQQYEPFLDMWSVVVDELDHDEIEA